MPIISDGYNNFGKAYLTSSYRYTNETTGARYTVFEYSFLYNTECARLTACTPGNDLNNEDHSNVINTTSQSYQPTFYPRNDNVNCVAAEWTKCNNLQCVVDILNTYDDYNSTAPAIGFADMMCAFGLEGTITITSLAHCPTTTNSTHCIAHCDRFEPTVRARFYVQRPKPEDVADKFSKLQEFSRLCVTFPYQWHVDKGIAYAAGKKYEDSIQGLEVVSGSIDNSLAALSTLLRGLYYGYSHVCECPGPYTTFIPNFPVISIPRRDG